MTPLPSSISGRVIKGLQHAGGLGYPTANLALDSLPDIPCGIYLGYATFRGSVKALPSIIFYGTPYALGESALPRFEVHILEKKGLTLYNKKLKVVCEYYVRPNQKFFSMKKLQTAIQHDLRQAKKYFSKKRR